MPSSKISVMIVDDSSTARRILSDIINRHPQMEVVAAVADPYEAVPELKKRSPNVMVLDVQMPRMDGITFLKKLMTIQPLPVVMCSSFTEKGSSISLQCLETGRWILLRSRRSRPSATCRNWKRVSTIRYTPQQ